MVGKQIRISDRLYQVHDWEEWAQSSGQTHACGKPMIGTFMVTLLRSVGIGAIVTMEGDGRSAIVDDEEPGASGEYLVKGSILCAGAGPLAEPFTAPPPASLPDTNARP